MRQHCGEIVFDSLKRKQGVKDCSPVIRTKRKSPCYVLDASRLPEVRKGSSFVPLFYCKEGVDGPYPHNYISFYDLVMSKPNEILYIQVGRNSGEEFETLVENMTW